MSISPISVPTHTVRSIPAIFIPGHCEERLWPQDAGPPFVQSLGTSGADHFAVNC
jgi:hypothetical protein